MSQPEGRDLDRSDAVPSEVQVEAAKLKLVTDRRLKQPTPEWVVRVAPGLPAR